MCKSNQRTGRSIGGNQSPRASLPLREWKRSDWEAEALSLGLGSVIGKGWVASATLPNLQVAVRAAWDAAMAAVIKKPAVAGFDIKTEAMAAEAEAKAERKAKARPLTPAQRAAINAARHAVALIWDGWRQPSQVSGLIEAGKSAGLTEGDIALQHENLAAADQAAGKQPGWPARESAERAKRAQQKVRRPAGGNNATFGGGGMMVFGSPKTKGKPRKVRGKKYGYGPGKEPPRPKGNKGGSSEPKKDKKKADKKSANKEKAKLRHVA